jgi:hypothetical protein
LQEKNLSCLVAEEFEQFDDFLFKEVVHRFSQLFFGFL